MTINVPELNILALLPLILVFGTGMLVLMLDLFTSNKRMLGWISLAGVVVAAVVGTLQQSSANFDPAFQNVALNDSYANFFVLIILSTAALSILIALGYLGRNGLERGEYYALLLFSTCGMMIMAYGTELMVIFLGLETMSIALYVMVAIDHKRRSSLEAGMKYFLMGSFASAFFLYGSALIYGATGSTNMTEIGTALAQSATKSPVALLGLGLLMVGFAFKVAAVPFHWWTPDVYQGAPTAVTTFMSVGAKAAGFAALVRLLMESFVAFQADWQIAVAVLAILTMTLGNVAALAQKEMKRLLAYSSIAHAGYIFVGIVAGTNQGVSAAIFYMLVYTFMNIGAFAVVGVLERQEDVGSDLKDYGGLAVRNPMLAAVMAIFMFSLTGFPLLGGFWGKVYLFTAAIDAGWAWLAVIAVINSGVAAFYYLGVIVQMYMRPVTSEPTAIHLNPATRLALGIATAATIILGVWPNLIVNLTTTGFFS